MERDRQFDGMQIRVCTNWSAVEAASVARRGAAKCTTSHLVGPVGGLTENGRFKGKYLGENIEEEQLPRLTVNRVSSRD